MTSNGLPHQARRPADRQLARLLLKCMQKLLKALAMPREVDKLVTINLPSVLAQLHDLSLLAPPSPTGDVSFTLDLMKATEEVLRVLVDPPPAACKHSAHHGALSSPHRYCACSRMGVVPLRSKLRSPGVQREAALPRGSTSGWRRRPIRRCAWCRLPPHRLPLHHLPLHPWRPHCLPCRSSRCSWVRPSTKRHPRPHRRRARPRRRQLRWRHRRPRRRQ